MVNILCKASYWVSNMKDECFKNQQNYDNFQVPYLAQKKGQNRLK